MVIDYMAAARRGVNGHRAPAPRLPAALTRNGRSLTKGGAA